MDLLSGLLLTGIVLWIMTIVIRELFDESISAGLARYFRSAPHPVEDALVGSIGNIIEVSGDGDSALRIRIGVEIWKARLQSSDGMPSVGAEVRVTAVDGTVLHVEAYSSA
jgi:membrane protein implicated in regulation of membrane protease activity